MRLNILTVLRKKKSVLGKKKSVESLITLKNAEGRLNLGQRPFFMMVSHVEATDGNSTGWSRFMDGHVLKTLKVL